MVSLSSVSTSTVNVNQGREQSFVRDDAAAREKQATTQAVLSSVSKSDSDSQKNYRQAQDFADARLPDPSEAQGNRRGSLLDLTV